MVFGDVGVERLQVNDDTLWSGGPGDWDTPGAKAALAEVRRLALAGDYAAADKAAHGLMGAFTQSYLPLGDLWLTFEHGNLGRDYRRELRLGDAVATVRYRVGDVRYTREVIASAPAGVIAVRIAADRPGLVTFDARVASPLRHAVTVEDGVIRLRGVAPAHVEPSYYQDDVPVQYGRDGGVPAGQWAAGEKPQPHKGRRTLPGMRFELAVGVVAEGGDGVRRARRAFASKAPTPPRCCSRRPRRSTASTRIRPATAATPARSSCGRSPPLARPRGPPCATPTSPTIARCSIA